MLKSIGIIGMGEMGRMYANHLRQPHIQINVCDRAENFEALQREFADQQDVNVLRDGFSVSRCSDLIIYSVEAEFIDKVVATYGPSTKQGAVVAAQTSVKAPERKAFDAHLPPDVSIISLHSLHGPTVSPEGQPLCIIIQYRATSDQVAQVEHVMAPLRSRVVHMTYDEHDEVTANTQAVTHAAFLSMGTAWHQSGRYPWETTRYIGGIETVKVNIALRIYAAKWHVYAGLAILNPAARKQIDQYARSVSQLFKLMIEERLDELRSRIHQAKDFVFGQRQEQPVFVSDDVFNAFTVGRPPPVGQDAAALPPANSHLSLLAMVDCWATLGIHPFKHLELAATPIFRLWFGVVEYLFRSPERLERAMQAAVHDKTHRSDDAEFMVAARAWSQCVSYGNFEWYKHRFQETADFFSPRFEDAGKVSARMIKEVLARDQHKKQ